MQIQGMRFYIFIPDILINQKRLHNITLSHSRTQARIPPSLLKDSPSFKMILTSKPTSMVDIQLENAIDTEKILQHMEFEHREKNIRKKEEANYIKANTESPSILTSHQHQQ